MNDATNNDALERDYEPAQLDDLTPDTKVILWEDDTAIMATVVKVAKGWVTISTADGERKVRAKQLELAQDPQAKGMADTLSKYRKRYVPSVAKSGKKSLHCGDSVAEALQYRELDELYTIAGQILEGWTAETLQAKYEHLNIGSQRMNLGNRIRAAFKRGDEAVVTWVEDNTGE